MGATAGELGKAPGHATVFVGKWHLNGRNPLARGFASAMWFVSNGSHANRQIIEQGQKTIARGYLGAKAQKER